jgi:hypothetical protein
MLTFAILVRSLNKRASEAEGIAHKRTVLIMRPVRTRDLDIESGRVLVKDGGAVVAVATVALRYTWSGADGPRRESLRRARIEKPCRFEIPLLDIIRSLAFQNPFIAVPVVYVLYSKIFWL